MHAREVYLRVARDLNPLEQGERLSVSLLISVDTRQSEDHRLVARRQRTRALKSPYGFGQTSAPEERLTQKRCAPGIIRCLLDDRLGMGERKDGRV